MVLDTMLKMVRMVMLGFPGREESSLSTKGKGQSCRVHSQKQREGCAHQKLGFWSESCEG